MDFALPLPRLADRVEEVLSDPRRLLEAGAAAAAKARAWDLGAYASEFETLLRRALGGA